MTIVEYAVRVFLTDSVLTTAEAPPLTTLGTYLKGDNLAGHELCDCAVRQKFYVTLMGALNYTDFDLVQTAISQSWKQTNPGDEEIDKKKYLECHLGP